MKNWMRTPFPFLIVLSVVIIGVSLSDVLAERVAETPRKVIVKSFIGQNKESFIWQFETDNSEVNDTQFKNDSLYVSAVELFKLKRFDRSEELFSTLINKYPLEPALLNYMGLIGMERREWMRATSFFETAIKQDTAYLPSTINLALVCSRMENYRKADSLYSSAIALAPGAARPRLNKGIMHCRTGEWEKAKVCLEPLLDNTTGFNRAKAESYYGMAAFNLQDTVSAIDHFRSAIEYAPTMITPRIYLGLCESSPEKSREELEKLAKVHPSYAPVHYYLALSYLDEGNNEEAQRLLEKAIELNPSDSDLSDRLGDFFIETEMIERARNHFDLVFGSDTLLPKKYFFRAKVASRDAARQNEAIDLYTEAITKSGGNYAEAYLNRGILLKKQGKLADAISSYEQAVESRVDYEEAWYNMALAHRAAGENNEAETCYRKAIEINPQAMKARYNLASILREKGRQNAAREEWRFIIQHDPDYAKAWYNLGVSYLREENYTSAIDIFTQMLNRFPSYTKAWFNLAQCRKQTGLIPEAIQAYEKAIEFDPSYVAAWKNLGNLHASQNEIDQAITCYRQAIDLDRTDEELRFNLALQYEKKGEITEALVQLNKAVQLKNDYLKAIGKWEKLATNSEDEYQIALASKARCDLSPDAECVYDYGRYFHKADRYNRAIAAYQQASNLGKNNVWVNYWWGKALEEAGNPQASIPLYQQALQINNNHKFSIYRMAIHPSLPAAEKRKFAQQLKEFYPEFANEKNVE